MSMPTRLSGPATSVPHLPRASRSRGRYSRRLWSRRSPIAGRTPRRTKVRGCPCGVHRGAGIRAHARPQSSAPTIETSDYFEDLRCVWLTLTFIGSPSVQTSSVVGVVMPWIHTRCRACGNQGVSPADPVDGTFDPGIGLVLSSLRAHCPDCGARGREAELVYGEPDVIADPELHAIWADMRAFLAGSGPARAGGVGRNEPCPCGSALKFKKCCGA
jgi:hypothetical protein